MYAERLARLRQEMDHLDLPAMLIHDPVNVRYLSGFTGTWGLLLITPQKALLVTGFTDAGTAREQTPDFDVVVMKDSPAKTLAMLLKGEGVASAGFESAYLPYATYQTLTKDVPSVTFAPVEDLVQRLRALKSDEEIALIREAVRVSDAAYDHLKQFARPGMTEKQVAWELEIWMRTHGAEDIAFETIVASGPNGAIPHAIPSDRELREGEPIVVDMGARVAGYHSDLTRTFCLGRADETFEKVFDVVLSAQAAAENGLRPGMTGRDADVLARDIITAEGYGEQFGHTLGHGVGLEVHELPYPGPRSEGSLESHNVLTVEPGIYLPGWGGVRIEDMALITDSGAEVLTHCSKDRVVPAARS